MTARPGGGDPAVYGTPSPTPARVPSERARQVAEILAAAAERRARERAERDLHDRTA